MNLKSNRNVHVYLMLLCVLSQGFGRSVDVQESTSYGEDTSDASDLEEVKDDSEDIDLNSSRGQDDLEERLNKVYSQIPPDSPETSQQREYSPQQDANFAVSNPFAEDDLNSAYLQNNSKMGSVDVKFDSGKLNAGNSTQPTFVKTFKTVNLKQGPVKEATGNEGEFSDTDYTGPGEENYHDSSANGLEIGESLETHKNNVEKTKIVPGENGAPKKLKIEEKEVKQIFHWNRKTTPAPVEGTNSPNVDAVLEKIETLDEHVLAGENFLAQSLQGVKERMRNFQEAAEKFQPLDKLSASKLINVTLAAAEAAIWNMCIKPIRDKLSVPKWSDWSPWGTCTLTCGKGGYSLRHRNCLSESQRRCLGNSFDIRPCDMEICPAIWLSWGHWSHCSASCDHGLRVRTRTCLTSNIKLHCMGSTAEVKDCFDQKCPVPMKVDEVNTSDEANTTGKENSSKDENTSIDENTPREENIQSEWNSSMEDRDGSSTDEKAEDEDVYPKESSPDDDERDRYLDGKSVRGKARKETMLSVSRAVEEEQFSHAAFTGPVWSSWTGWSMCKECGISNRDRKRICLNSTSHLPLESSFCSGAELELSPCSASSCPLEREFPNAPRISEGGTGELKCEVRSDESPRRVYWITPRTRHIMHQQPNRRVHMAGTSLVVTKARFSDQGKYQCVLMFGKGQHRVHSAPLIVETCADHNCKNGGECLTLPDPQFDKFKHYQCKCPASFDGPFCQNSLRGNKYIAPIIISVLCLVIAFALCLFLVLRSMKKKKNSEGKIWEKLGIQTYDRKMKKKSGDNSDVTNTSVVSNDDSFVEVTADDLEDYDHYEMPQESGSSGFYKTEDGYVVSPLKYPSPRQKLTYGLVSKNDEESYIEMESLPEQKRHMRKIKFSDEDAKALYENMPHSEAPLYENVPKGKAGASGGKPSPQKRKQRPTPEEVIDMAAEEIAQKCLKELQNQRFGKAGGQQSPNVTAPHRQSPNKGEIRTPTRVSQGQAQRSSPSPAPRVTGYRVPATESPSSDDQGHPLSKILAVKDKQQESEFLKHFGGSFVPIMQSQNTSTPKKEQPVSGKKVILPSDILSTMPKEDLTVNKVKKNLAKELMIITSQNVIGQQEQTPEVRDQENISNNGQTQAIPSECEIFYDESSYHSVDPQSDFSSRRESFLSANSASVRTLPDVDGTISFPKLSGQHTQEDTGNKSGNQYLPNTELFPNFEGSGVFTHTEGSVYLSDYHYTPDPSELYTSPSSNAQESEDEDEGEDEDEDESTESESSSHNSMALRYKTHHQ